MVPNLRLNSTSTVSACEKETQISCHICYKTNVTFSIEIVNKKFKNIFE